MLHPMTTESRISFYNQSLPKGPRPPTKISIEFALYMMGLRDILQEKVSQGKFLNWIRDRRGEFLSY